MKKKEARAHVLTLLSRIVELGGVPEQLMYAPHADRCAWVESLILLGADLDTIHTVAEGLYFPSETVDKMLGSLRKGKATAKAATRGIGKR